MDVRCVSGLPILVVDFTTFILESIKCSAERTCDTVPLPHSHLRCWHAHRHAELHPSYPDILR